MKFLILAIFVIVELYSSAQTDNQTTATQKNAKIIAGLISMNAVEDTTGLSGINITESGPTNERSLYQYLQGKISGLDIISASGDPGVNAAAILRGQNLTGPNAILIVIDGVPQHLLDNAYFEGNPYSEYVSNPLSIPLEDIQSVEIIKDGSATAIYGTEGSSGVILINTKKGSRHRMELKYQFNQSVIEKPVFLPMLSGDQYIMYQLEAFHNTYGVFAPPAEISNDPEFSEYYNYTANTDWLKSVSQTGIAFNNYLNISGGNKKNSYFGSVNYLHQKGRMINSGYNRFQSRLNFEHYFSDRLTLSFNLNYDYDNFDDNISFEDDYHNRRNILEMAFIKAPNISIWEYDEEGNSTGNYFTPLDNYQGPGVTYFNPVSVSENGNCTNTFNEFSGTANLQYQLKNWLNIRESFTYYKASAVTNAYLPYSSLVTDFLFVHDDIISRLDNKVDRVHNELAATIEMPFQDRKKNQLRGIFGWIIQNSDLSNANEYYNREIYNHAAVSSILYKFIDRYMLNVNLRMENLPSNRDKWSQHYGVDLGWRFSNESFFRDIKFLTNGKIHAGLSYSDYTLQDYELNTDLSYNMGLEFSLFANRIHFRADSYIKTWDMNINMFIAPAEYKFVMKNKGWEGMFDYDVLKMKNLDWTFYFNMAHNNIVIDELPGNFTSGSEKLYSGEYVYLLKENESFGGIYGLKNEGIYATDQDAIARDKDGNILNNADGDPVFLSYENYTFRGGDTKYKDMNYDGKIDGTDLIYLGNSRPKYTGGFGSNLRYRNVTLTLNFHYRMGNKIINQVSMDSEGMIGNHNQNKNVLNRWRVEGQQSPDMLPAAYFNHPANYLGSDLYVESGSFIRLNYVNLGYKFNPEICQKTHLKDLSISISAQRLLTFSRYRGLDPEIETSGLFSQAKDNIRLYPPKVFTCSIQITL